MDIDAFEKSLEQDIRPIYTFVGNQPFLFEMVQEALREAMEVGPFADMNTDLFHATERGALDRALEITGQLPMMAKRRLVIIKEAEAIKGKDVERLAAYLASPSEFCCLALFYAKLAKNTKVWKRSNKHGLALAFERIYERHMPFWIKRMALRNGKEITGQAVNFLTRAVGPDLGKANAELEKASLYAGSKETIDMQDVEAILSTVKAENIFELTDAIGAKDRMRAIHLSKKMLDAGEQPLRILWQVGNHMRRLMLVRSLLSSGAPTNQIGRALGVMDFVRDKLVAQARVFSRRELRLAMTQITKTDLELKSGRLNNRIVLEKMMLDLCGMPGLASSRKSVRRSR